MIQKGGADHTETPILCVAGRGPLDEAASAMLAQLLEKHGFRTIAAPYAAASRETIGRLETKGVTMVCISYLEVSGSPPHLRYTVRRLRQKLPGSSILVGLWPASDAALTDQGMRAQIGADYYARSLQEAVDLCTHANPKDEGLSASSSPPGTTLQASRVEKLKDCQFRTFCAVPAKDPEWRVLRLPRAPVPCVSSREAPPQSRQRQQLRAPSRPGVRISHSPCPDKIRQVHRSMFRQLRRRHWQPELGDRHSAGDELGTNSAKYGAPSADAGSVTVSWSVKDGQLDLR